MAVSNSDGKVQGIAVPARIIPPPQTISPEAQAFLSQAPRITAPQIDPGDKEGWRQYAAQIEVQLALITEGWAKSYPAEVIEHRLSAAKVYDVKPETLTKPNADKAIFHIHGGAFIVGGGRSAANAAQPLASLAKMRVFSVDYRMPPDHPFPTGLNDAVEAYRWLLERYKPENIAFHGSSAGANLAASVILQARDMGLPLPGACVLHTAAVDLTYSGDTFTTNAYIDVVLQRAQADIMLLYSGGHDLKDPYLSPVFGDFSKGFAPTILLSGTRDLLLSSTVMMHRALRRAGVKAELHVFEGMPHGGFGARTPEDRELLDETVNFITENLGRR